MALGTQVTIGSDDDPIVIELGKPYSCIWATNYTLCSFLDDVVDQYVSSTSEAILYTEETPQNEWYPYDEVKAKISNETPRFFRLNTEIFDLTWELKADDKPWIGFIADEPYPYHIKRLYETTTEANLSDEGVDLLITHLR